MLELQRKIEEEGLLIQKTVKRFQNDSYTKMKTDKMSNILKSHSLSIKREVLCSQLHNKC